MRTRSLMRRLGAVAGTAVLATAGLAGPAAGQEEPYPGCPGFGVWLTLNSAHGNPPQVGPRAVIAAGTQSVTITNATSGASTTVRTAGAITRQVTSPDGTTVSTFVGRTVLIQFPTDPGGPSSVVYAGKVVYESTAAGITSVLSATGTTTDLCALLES